MYMLSTAQISMHFEHVCMSMWEGGGAFITLSQEPKAQYLNLWLLE